MSRVTVRCEDCGLGGIRTEQYTVHLMRNRLRRPVVSPLVCGKFTQRRKCATCADVRAAVARAMGAHP